jgi:adenine specific DNA methylase Mod
MDYIEDIAVKRMQKVIGATVKKDGELLESLDFDAGGISKSVDWQGGGEFIYFEWHRLCHCLGGSQGLYRLFWWIYKSNALIIFQVLVSQKYDYQTIVLFLLCQLKSFLFLILNF